LHDPPGLGYFHQLNAGTEHATPDQEQMPQIFHRSTNTLSKVSIFGAVFLLAFMTWAFAKLERSSYSTGQGVILEQPVPFSHDHHVAALGIDCRYCHTSVEEAAFAGMPPTATCMNCHSQIWSQSPMLEPVRESFKTDIPIQWTRVNDLPDYVYFDHSIHVVKGIGCDTCHGPVHRMPLMWRHASLQMEWCLDCHRNPERYVRPREEVFNMAWQWPAERDPLEEGQKRVEEYGIQTLDSCSTCHR
jgi:hypothetical protein